MSRTPESQSDQPLDFEGAFAAADSMKKIGAISEEFHQAIVIRLIKFARAHSKRTQPDIGIIKHIIYLTKQLSLLHATLAATEREFDALLAQITAENSLRRE